MYIKRLKTKQKVVLDFRGEFKKSEKIKKGQIIRLGTRAPRGVKKKLTDEAFLLLAESEYGMHKTAALTPDNSIGRLPGRSQVSRDGS